MLMIISPVVFGLTILLERRAGGDVLFYLALKVVLAAGSVYMQMSTLYRYTVESFHAGKTKTS
jgi:hypothetical protein